MTTTIWDRLFLSPRSIFVSMTSNGGLSKLGLGMAGISLSMPSIQTGNNNSSEQDDAAKSDNQMIILGKDDVRTAKISVSLYVP